MSKKFLRHPNQFADDSDESEEDDEELSDDEANSNNRKPPSNNNNNNDNKSSSDDDEDDEDDEDDDDDPPPKSDKGSNNNNNNKRKANSAAAKPPRGSKRTKASAFIELEAEASDDEEEEEESAARGRGNEDGERMDRDTLEAIRLQDRRRQKEGGNFLERTAAEMARDIEERHRMANRAPHGRTLGRPGAPRPPVARKPAAPAAAAAKGKGSAAAAASEKAGAKARSAGGGAGGPAAPAAAAAAPATPPPVHHRHDEEMMEEEAMVEGGGGGEAYGGGAVHQQSLMPSVSDPSFWMVNCLHGKEQDMVMQIMNKAVAFAKQNKPLGITGVIAAQSKGRIYIESFSEPAVMEAVQNVRGLMPSSMKLVPISDMTTVMTVTSKKKPVQKNEWVRMTRGHYKGDLALVKEVRDSGLKCIVQCVPRIDLTAEQLSGEAARVRRKTFRPPQKFFSPQELKAVGKHNILRQMFPGLNLFCYMFDGNYYKDGYLLKEMTVGSMVKPCTDDDKPTLEELQSFQRRKGSGARDEDDEDDEGEENEGSKMAGSLLDELAELQKKTGFDKSSSQGSGGLLIGDTVEVMEGDLIGVQGKIISMDGATVKVKPFRDDLPQEIEFLATQVRKHIPVGTHVKVMDGRYANETGQVVAVEKLEGGGDSADDYTAVILTDVTSKEITVRISQLRESVERATGQDILHGFGLYDLVALSGGGSANEVGVIVRVGREDFTAVNNHGIAREVRPEELRGKKNTMSNKAVALDVQGNHIRCGDTVNVVEGRHKGKSATIKRMNRSQLFLHSQTRSEHAGIFVVKSRSCVLAGSRSQNRGGGAGAGGSSPWTPQSNQSSRGPGPNRKRDDGLIGKTVRIQAGNWKGFIGTVADTTGTHVQVELHARLKKVMVTHERVHVIGDKFGATETQTNNPVVNPTVMAPTTPFVAAGQTPMHGGATPMHGNDDGGDEVWRPGGSVDQDGSQTAQDANDDGWGATTNDQQDGGDADEGWGSGSQGDGGWGAPPTAAAAAAAETEAPAAAVKQEPAMKREQQSSEMEHEMAENEERPGWLMERVCVTLKNKDKEGFVKEILPTKIVVDVGDGSTESVGANEISMVQPVEHDPVLVTGGNEVGLEGTLVCIDGTDAILKDANDAFKIVEFSFLAKLKHN